MRRAAVLALALTLACSKHEAANVPPPTAPDPCTLITSEELKQITGTPVRNGEGTGETKTASRCVWQEGGEAGAGSITIAIHVLDIEAVLGQFRNLPGNEKIDGLGEEAYWNNAIGQLTVRTGQRVVTISFNASGGAAEHKAASIEIAKKILSAL